MARIIINASEGPNVHIGVNGTFYTLDTDEEIVVSSSQLEVLTSAEINFRRIWRSTNTQLAALTIDEDTVTDAASVDDVVGTIGDALEDSVITMDDPSELFALDGLDLLVADTLVADTYDIDFTETNEEIENSPRTTTIQITVSAA